MGVDEDHLGPLVKLAVQQLAAAARVFGQMKPRKNVSGPYGRAFRELFEAAQAWAKRSDEQWAMEIVELREENARLRAELDDITVERDQLQQYKDRNPL